MALERSRAIAAASNVPKPPTMDPAVPGIGLAMEIIFAVPADTLSWWRDRLAEQAVTPPAL